MRAPRSRARPWSGVRSSRAPRRRDRVVDDRGHRRHRVPGRCRARRADRNVCRFRTARRAAQRRSSIVPRHDWIRQPNPRQAQSTYRLDGRREPAVTRMPTRQAVRTLSVGECVRPLARHYHELQVPGAVGEREQRTSMEPFREEPLHCEGIGSVIPLVSRGRASQTQRLLLLPEPGHEQPAQGGKERPDQQQRAEGAFCSEVRAQQLVEPTSECTRQRDRQIR